MSIYPDNVVADINSRLDVKRLLELIGYKVDKIQDAGETVKGFCPIHGESLFRTLIIDKSRKTFRCLYGLCEGTEGGNLIHLYALARKIPFDEAINTLVRELGIDVQLPVDEDVLDRNAEIAENYLEIGALDEAEKEFRQIVEIRPDYRRAQEGLQQIYAQTGNAEGEYQARKALTRLCLAERDYMHGMVYGQPLVESHPEDLENHRMLAECSYGAGDRDLALTEYLAVADISETNRDYASALDAYRRVDEMELDTVDAVPHIVRLHVETGNTAEAIEYVAVKAEKLAQRGEYERAADLYASVLDVDPKRTDLRTRCVDIASLAPPGDRLRDLIFQTIDAALADEDKTPAATALERLLEHPAYGGEALARLTEFYHSQGRENEAAALQVRNARMNYQAGHAETALRLLRDLTAVHPDHVGALELMLEIEETRGTTSGLTLTMWKLGELYAHDGRYSESVGMYDRILRIDPESLETRERRAQVLEEWGNTADPSMLDAAALAYEQLGDYCKSSTSIVQAIQHFEKAMNLAPAKPESLVSLARLYHRSGDELRARETALRAGEMLVSENRAEEAVTQVEGLSDFLGKDPACLRFLAEAYARIGNLEASTNRFCELAKTCSVTGDLRQAEEILERAVSVRPNYAPALEQLAEVHRQRHDSAAHIRTLFRLAAVYEEQQMWSKAIEALGKLVDENPTEITAVTKLIQLTEDSGELADAQRHRLKLAAIHRDRGDSEREARVLRDALLKSPDDEDILAALVSCEFARDEPDSACLAARRLAAIKKRAGRDAEARGALAGALEKAPDNLDINRDLFELLCEGGLRQDAVARGLRLVDLYMPEGRSAEAAATYEQVVSSDPDNLTLKLNQVEFLKRIGRDDEAMEKLFSLSKLYQLREHFDEAENLLLQALADDPANIRAREEVVDLYERLGSSEKLEDQLCQLADAYGTSGEVERAVASLQRVLQWNPDSVKTRRLLADFFLGQSQQADAIRELHALAATLRRGGSEVEALEAEREAAVLAPDNIQVRRRLVDGLTRAGEAAQAAKELEQIADLQIDKQKLNEAMQTIAEWLQLQPDSLSARRMRAELYSKMGDNARALEEFRALAASIPDVVTAQRAEESAPPAPYQDQFLQLVKEYDFEHFVVGSHNNFAYATALAVARAPARAYNPLFIYSDVGLGKTHLANAIAHHVLVNDPKARIIYTNSEDFTGEVVAAIQGNAINQFRMRYKSVDLLIVDDVQFLAGKERAQEEFFHIFNALFQAKRQIVVTSDRPPKDIARLENRLLSRFGAGVIVDVQPPDVETRIAILNREVQSNGWEIDAPIVVLIAERIDTNIRELKGALNQAIAMRDLRNVPLTDENVRNMLDTVYVRT